ncbi:MAG: DUF411 domain-containing protein [Caldilineaceae bacterium]
MEDNGFAVTSEPVSNLGQIKLKNHVPTELQSCHTAIVDGYVIEGHVPAEDVERLLQERPDIVGLAVPGMPVGSPGMEVEGYPDEPFDVIAFDKNGRTEVFASHTD